MELDFQITPEDIQRLYEAGTLKGTMPDPAAFRMLHDSAPRFHSAMPEAKNASKGKVSLPFKACLQLDPEFGGYESQTTGDCVSHGTRNASMLDYCIDVIFGETKWMGRLATENIYGARGHSGQGASCSRLCYFIGPQGKGGLLYRKDYGRGADLSKYNSRIGHNWGRSGTPSWLNDIANENKAQRVMNVKSVQEAADAIACGFGINMCSSYGFSSKRDQYGLSRRTTTWHHAMAWIAVDCSDWAIRKYGGPSFLVQNSWGSHWISGPTRHDQPRGSFWIDYRTANQMIRSGGGWICASVQGYNRELVMDRRSVVSDYSMAA